MCVKACIAIIILLIMVHQMYLIGGYAYTPEELCKLRVIKHKSLH